MIFRMRFRERESTIAVPPRQVSLGSLGVFRIGPVTIAYERSLMETHPEMTIT
jgi:hypothetical protein